jgi:hypothetical protein
VSAPAVEPFESLDDLADDVVDDVVDEPDADPSGPQHLAALAREVDRLQVSVQRAESGEEVW